MNQPIPRSPQHQESEPSFDAMKEHIAHLEKRLADLEQRPAATPTVVQQVVRSKKVEKPNSLRKSRGYALLFGFLFLLFGNFLFNTDVGWMFGAALLVYAIIISIVVQPEYTESHEVEHPLLPSMSQATQTVQTENQATPKVSVEVDIGKRIFAWVGIIALLIGITFFVSYSFQHFGNTGKLFVGYGVALVLFAAGRKLRNSLRAFSYVLEGGGWAAAYFMTYATSFVPELNVINKPVVSLVLLLIVTALMVLVSLIEKSPAFTAAAFFLGYLTAAIGGTYGIFTLWATLALSLAVLAISLRLHWYVFGVLGTLASYIAYAAWLAPFTKVTFARSDLLTGLLFLVVYGLVFGIGHILATPDVAKKENDIIRFAVVLNVVFSMTGALYLFSLGNTQAWVVMLIYSGILFCFFALSQAFETAKYLATPYLVLAILAVSSFIPMKFTDGNVTILWVAETAALTLIGTLTRDRTLRVLGYILGVVATLSGAVMLLSLTSLTQPARLFFATVTVIAGWLILATILAQFRDRLPHEEKIFPWLFGDASIVLLTMFISAHAPHTWISPIVGLLGVLVLVSGFARRSAHLRGLGIVVLAYTVVRVFLFDVAGLDTFGKMISFIILGALLLGVAYLYNKSRLTHEHSGNGEQQ